MIACENAVTGNLASEWDVPGAGDTSIQGFATDMSVNRGQTISFKVKTTAKAYRLDIYRVGYYNGRGARKVTTITPSVSLPQTQPACVRSTSTGLYDCGNWAVSASWNVPSSAVSGVYLAKLVRTDTGGASHIIFIVRDDFGNSDLLYQTSDTTWQAYNRYGGTTLYGGTGPASDGRAYKVSYNRPFDNRAPGTGDSTPLGYFFTAEYPMIRWLEANGYNVSYASGMDTDRRGSAALKTHKVFLSVGHDEYWSGAQRANVEAARAAGVHLAFFSGNEIFWKTRWENSTAGTSTSYRTLVCYKETHANAKIDPTSTWTGTWRDPRFSPPSDGGRPENALSGQIFTVNGDRSDAMSVSSADGKLRFWRNTGLDQLIDGEKVVLPQGLLGYEWDEALDNGYRPLGLVTMSSTTLNVDGYYLQDYGTRYGPGTATHSLSLYRHASGALVFGAGTAQWSWGLDATHDYPGTPADVRVQQATVNLFTDMGIQPATIRAGLQKSSSSGDTLPPASQIKAPASLSVPAWTPLTIFGTATDLGGGRPAGVDVSLDNGSTWHPAYGAANWSASWLPTSPGVMTFRSRAVDDSCRVETPLPAVPITVTLNSARASLWSPTAVPTILQNSDPLAVELGVRFKPDRNGWITALRFHKGPDNLGTHVGNLWRNDGTLLGSVTFTSETASGWQEAQLATPVPVTAGTYYVASYHTDNGHYSHDVGYFSGRSLTSGPLFAPADGAAGGNGLYRYGASGFPTDTSQGSNYWVDVAFAADLSPDITPPLINGVTPQMGFGNAGVLTSVSAQFNEPMNAGSFSAATFFLKEAATGSLVSVSLTYDPGSRTAILQPAAALKTKTIYTATVKGGTTGVRDLAGNKMPLDVVWSFTTGAASVGGYTLWSPTAIPTLVDMADTSAVELGVRFKADRDGVITAIRYYKSSANTGTHLGNLWGTDGTLLATVTFTGESTSGWQQAQFSTPVPITAGTYYIASYHTNTGHYADDSNYFAGKGVNASPLYAPADGVAGANGVYHYGSSAFPTDTAVSSNYWVDVVFNPSTVTAPPQFSPLPGTYNLPISVSITDSTSGAQIYYTLDGTPASAASTPYSGPLALSNATTLNAIAIAAGKASTNTAGSYFFQAGTPTFSIPGGTYTTAQVVSLADVSPGAQIYYTLDGTTPTLGSTLYTTPIAISATTTVKTFATVAGWTDSAVATVTYVIDTTSTTPPAAPSNLSATVTDVSRIDLAWTDQSTNETGFKIERRIGTTGSFIQIATAAANVTSYSDTTVVASTTYSYRVRATNSVGDSAYSALANATTPAPGALPAPWVSQDIGTTGRAGSASYAASSGTFTVNGAGADITSQVDAFQYVYQTITGNAEIVTRVTSIQNTDPAAKAGLMMRETTATNAETAAIVLTPSKGVSFLARTATGAKITSSSGPSVGAPYWLRLVRSGNTFTAFAASDGISWTQVGSASIPMNASVTVGLAVTSRTTTALCQATFTDVSLITEPSAPTGLTANGVSSTQVDLSWTDTSSNENGFKIERKTSIGGTYAQIATVPAGTTGYSNTGLTPSTTYYYRVRSTNSAGDSAYSNEAKGVTGTSGTVPAVPAGLTAAAASSSQVNLAWSDVANETGFKIERKTGSGGTYSQIGTVAASVVTYADTGLAPGTLYFYRVRATNGAGDSGYSNEASATTTSAPTFRSSAAKGATSGVQSLVINKPAGTAQGDVMVAAISIRPSTATINISGWTLVRRINNSSGNSNSLAVYYKVAGASEPSSYTWSLASSTGSAGGISSFSGVDPANPIDVESGQSTASNLSQPAPSVTTRYANDMLVTAHAFASSAALPHRRA